MERDTPSQKRARRPVDLRVMDHEPGGRESFSIGSAACLAWVSSMKETSVPKGPEERRFPKGVFLERSDATWKGRRQQCSPTRLLLQTSPVVWARWTGGDEVAPLAAVEAGVQGETVGAFGGRKPSPSQLHGFLLVECMEDWDEVLVEESRPACTASPAVNYRALLPSR